MSKIGPKEAARRAMREQPKVLPGVGSTATGTAPGARDIADTPVASGITAEPAVPNAETMNHTEYMRNYMQRWRRGEVGHRHKDKLQKPAE